MSRLKDDISSYTEVLPLVWQHLDKPFTVYCMVRFCGIVFSRRIP